MDGPILDYVSDENGHTPYMHSLVMHVSEFIDLYVSLKPFSQQGLEKLSDLTTIHYMRSTNH